MTTKQQASTNRASNLSTALPKRSFQFDPERLELRQSGYSCRLEFLPARMLAYLLERHNQVVTRTELVKLLWPHETHGDFAHRLDKVLHKLRVALRDDASSPAYIETLRGSGFRFIGGATIDQPARPACSPSSAKPS